jgi:hypothetical protein
MASAALQASLGAKTARTLAAVEEQRAAVRGRTAALSALQRELEAAQRVVARVDEYRAAGLAPAHDGVCAEAPPAAVLTFRLRGGEAGDDLTVGVPAGSQLDGRRVEVDSVDTARCVGAWLRGCGFVAPPPAALRDLLSVADALALDDLLEEVRRFILANT